MGSISNTKEIAMEVLPFIRTYKDGSIDRLIESPFVPPLPLDPQTGVSSKDITISQNPLIQARVYLPKLSQPHQKFPILVYIHGGAFCFESAFSFTESRCLSAVVSQANVLAVSVEYRRAPEHHLPIAYEDCWAALQWVCSHFTDGDGIDREPWLINNGDFDRVFLGGDSAGANIVHNVLMRAGVESLIGGVKISGAYLTHPLFWGSEAVGSENVVDREKGLAYKLWDFVCPSAPGGIDNVSINPFGEGKPSLSQLGTTRLFVSVAEHDELVNRGILYCDQVRKSGWKGDLEMVQVKGEDHAFHILKFEDQNSKDLIASVVHFLVK